MSSNQSQSYQLPDLLGTISSLELRTNRHCCFATEVSERWLQTKATKTSTGTDFEPTATSTSSQSGSGSGSNNGKILHETELSYLPSAKLGLLTALCFPTCDAPQLRVLIDFVSLLFYSVLRENLDIGSASGAGTLLRESDVQTQTQTHTGSLCDLDSGTPSKSGFDLLRKDDLLRHIIDRRILNLSSTASESWKKRFTKSVSDFQAARLRLRLRPRLRCQRPSQNQHENENDNNNTVPIPSLEEYTSLARELYGVNMVLDLAELMEVFRFPDVDSQSQRSSSSRRRHMEEMITQLKDAALDVIVWSTDVVSYQHTKIRGQENPYNLITILMHHNGLSVQGAMNLSGVMIKQAFSSFCSAERSIIAALDDKHKPLGSPVLSSLSLSWVWNWMALVSSGASDHENPPSPSSVGESNFSDAISSSSSDQSDSVNTKRYIQALKDTIVGLVHWVYETELFFGKKGGEIRSFGWVFVDHLDDDQPVLASAS